MHYHPDRLTQLISKIFEKAGSARIEADDIAEHLVMANLTGHDSHGVIRTPIYLRWLKEGSVVANQKLKVLFENDCFAVTDGQFGYGQAIGKQLMNLGISKCRQQGVALTAVRNCGHLGRIGHWAEITAGQGLISIHFVNTSGLGMFVVPAGGIDARLSVNPITMGVPVQGRPPVILDIAAAAAAEGKLKVARNKGESVPDGWILDAEGHPTNDPNKFYGPPMGAILPVAGYKGYGLAFMVELLAGALTGGGCSQAGKTRLEQSMLSIFLDPDRIHSKDVFHEEVCRYIDFVRSSRPADPSQPVMIPGEIESRKTEQRRGEGIELDTTTWEQIVSSAREVNVEEELIEAAAMS